MEGEEEEFEGEEEEDEEELEENYTFQVEEEEEEIIVMQESFEMIEEQREDPKTPEMTLEALKEQTKKNFRLQKLPQKTFFEYLKHHLFNQRVSDVLQANLQNDIKNVVGQIVSALPAPGEVTSSEIDDYVNLIKEYYNYEDISTLHITTMNILRSILPTDVNLSIVNFTDEGEIYGWEEDIYFYVAELPVGSSPLVPSSSSTRNEIFNLENTCQYTADDKLIIKENRKTLLYVTINFTKPALSVLIKMIRVFTQKFPHEKRFDILIFSFTITEEVAKITDRMGFKFHLFLR